MKRIILCAWMALGCLSTVNGQVVYEQRVEIPLKDDYNEEKVLPMGSNGMIIQSQRKLTTGKGLEMRFQLFDTQLQLRQEQSVPLEGKFPKLESISTEDRIHLFQNAYNGKARLTTVDANNLKSYEVAFQVPKNHLLKGAVGFENRYYGGMIKKKIPYMFSIDWESGELKTIPPIMAKRKPRSCRIVGVEKVNGSNEVAYIIQNVTVLYRTELWIYTMDDEGKPGIAVNLGENIDEKLINASISCVGPGKYIATGTYSLREAGRSSGLFFAQISNEKVSFIKLYNFLDLDNFLSYLSERKEARILKKKERKEASGKELTIDYNLAPHQIIPTTDGYIYIAEAYYPTYVTYSTTNASGVTTYRTQFDGFQYTHATVVKFDEAGNIVWDQVFELWPAYKPWEIIRFINIPQITNNTVDLMYLSHGTLHYKSIDFDGTILQDEESEKIDTGLEGDNTKWTNSEFNWWYDKHYLAYGSQKIKNQELEKGERRRKVFFVNKIRYNVSGN